MLWPFNNDGGRNSFFHDEIDKEFENMLKEFESIFNIPYDQNPSKSPPTTQNPRELYLEDARHAKERIRSESPLADREVNIGDNYEALLNPNEPSSHALPSLDYRPPSSVQESISTSVTIKNGKCFKEERRERIEGRKRKISITSTDGDGNVSSREYTEDV